MMSIGSHLVTLYTFSLLFSGSYQICFLDEIWNIPGGAICRDLYLSDLNELDETVGFANITFLTLLNFSAEINKNMFLDMTDLYKLEIANGNISVFKPEADNLLDLTLLYSYFQKATNFDKCCKNLQSLYIRLTSGLDYEGPLFQELKDLRNLTMSVANSEHLNEFTFKGLRSLEKLDIAFNGYKTMDPRAFSDLVNLRELKIEEPKVSFLNETIFEPLKKLQKISVNIKYDKYLKPDHFKKLTELRVLRLTSLAWQTFDFEKIPELFPNLIDIHFVDKYDEECDKVTFAKMKVLKDKLRNRTVN